MLFGSVTQPNQDFGFTWMTFFVNFSVKSYENEKNVLKTLKKFFNQLSGVPALESLL